MSENTPTAPRMTNNFTIRDGAYYIDARGDLHGPMSARSGVFLDQYGGTYYANGVECGHVPRSASTLVAERDRKVDELERDLAAREAELARVREERDAAFKMSKCECQSEEACANLVKAWADRDSWRAKAEANERDAERWKTCLDAEGVSVSIFNCDPASWRYPEGEQLIAAIDAIRTGAENAWQVPIYAGPAHDESPPIDAIDAAREGK